jgi:hypothetical protein
MIQNIPDKVCKKCGGTEWYGYQVEGKDCPLRYACKSCKSKRPKFRGAWNTEAKKAYDKAYREKHRQRLNERAKLTNKKWQKANRDKVKTYHTKYHENNKDSIQVKRSLKAKTKASLITKVYVQELIANKRPISASQVVLSDQDYEMYKEILTLKRQHNGKI